jgi:Ankyrin repeats (3 copies)
MPSSIVQAIIEAHPDGVRTKESSFSRLPLHCACKRSAADPEIIALLIKAHGAACLVPDSVGRLPIHYALSNGASTAIIHLLLAAQPDSAKGVDLNGWCPLHVACSVGNKDAIIALVQIFPEATFFRTTHGSTPTMCLSKATDDRDEVKRLLKAARQRFDATFVNPMKTQRTSLVLETNSALV